MRQATKAVLLALGCASLTPRSALADNVSGTRSELLKETIHDIQLSVARRHAELVVRRTVHNGGDRHDQAMFYIDMPSGAVATGLRTLGMEAGRPVWFTAELMEAEAAAAKYRELTGIGGYYPKDPALLSFRSQDLLALQVFPVAPKDKKTIEYTLQLPTQYSGGKHHLSLPRIGTGDLAATIKAKSADPADVLSIDGKPFTAAAPVTLRDDGGIEFALAPRSAPSVGGALAMVPFAKNRILLHYGIEAAPRLSEVPRGAHVVVVIDNSRSLTHDEGTAALAMVKAYLSHFKDGKAEILTFDRHVHARHGKFVPAAQALAALSQLALGRRNGSHLDSALSRAESLLAALPPATPRRIVAITDLRTRQALTPESIRGIAGRSGAVVHLGVVHAGWPDISRVDDADPWAKAIRPTGGVVWNAHASSDAGAAARMTEVYEEWARPVRIDRLKISAPGIDPDTLDYPDCLDEGEGVEDLRIAERQVPWVDVQGELWSTPVRKVLVPDEDEGRLWSALVFGSPLLYELSEEEMMPLARRGHAVSPVTSLLAVEPGVRPSTEGLDWGGLGLSGIGDGGGGRGEGIALGSIGTIGFDKAGFLRKELASRLSRCGGAGRHATVRVESTLDEIVEMRVKHLSGDRSTQIEQCVEEGGWGIELPNAFYSSWEGFTIEI
jgi:hypothetical protein